MANLLDSVLNNQLILGPFTSTQSSSQTTTDWKQLKEYFKTTSNPVEELHQRLDTLLHRTSVQADHYMAISRPFTIIQDKSDVQNVLDISSNKELDAEFVATHLFDDGDAYSKIVSAFQAIEIAQFHNSTPSTNARLQTYPAAINFAEELIEKVRASERAQVIDQPDTFAQLFVCDLSNNQHNVEKFFNAFSAQNAKALQKLEEQIDTRSMKALLSRFWRDITSTKDETHVKCFLELLPVVLPSSAKLLRESIQRTSQCETKVPDVFASNSSSSSTIQTNTRFFDAQILKILDTEYPEYLEICEKLRIIGIKDEDLQEVAQKTAITSSITPRAGSRL